MFQVENNNDPNISCIPKEKSDRLQIFLDDLMKDTMKKRTDAAGKAQSTDRKGDAQMGDGCRHNCSRCCVNKASNKLAEQSKGWKQIYSGSQNLTVRSVERSKELLRQCSVIEEKKVYTMRVVDKAVNTDPMDIKSFLEEQVAKMKKTLESLPESNKMNSLKQESDSSQGQKTDESLLDNWAEEDLSKNDRCSQSNSKDSSLENHNINPKCEALIKEEKVSESPNSLNQEEIGEVKQFSDKHLPGKFSLDPNYNFM